MLITFKHNFNLYLVLINRQILLYVCYRDYFNFHQINTFFNFILRKRQININETIWPQVQLYEILPSKFYCMSHQIFNHYYLHFQYFRN